MFTPTISLAASVQITEVMYDPPGANTGHQWVEVTNLGSGSANLAGYKLFEGGTNHGLSITSGTDSTSSLQATTLAAGQSAIISNNTGDFLADFPNYSGTLFKSAFSLLSKTGDTIILKDASLVPVDTVEYDPSAGAAGDGNSLHRSGGTFVVGAPNPGSTAPASPMTAPTQTSGTSAKTAASAKSTAPKSSAGKTTAASNTNYNQSASQAAALGGEAPLLSQINLPQGPWAYALGGVGILFIGISALWYMRLSAVAQKRNVLRAEEFDIEG